MCVGGRGGGRGGEGVVVVYKVYRLSRTLSGLGGQKSVRFSRAHGAGFPGVRGVRRWISQREILEGTLHKFDFDPQLQKNWVTGESWELKAPASFRHCDPSRGGQWGHSWSQRRDPALPQLKDDDKRFRTCSWCCRWQFFDHLASTSIFASISMGRGTAWKAHDVDVVRGWLAAGKTTTAMATLRPDWPKSSIKKLVARLPVTRLIVCHWLRVLTPLSPSMDHSFCLFVTSLLAHASLRIVQYSLCFRRLPADIPSILSPCRC